MFDDINNIKEEMMMHMLGKRHRAGHAKAKPIGDRMINAVRGAIWEAWRMGIDGQGSMYPSVPILDQLSQPKENMEEVPKSLFSSTTHIVPPRYHPVLDDEPYKQDEPVEPVEPAEPEP